jgi:hypothetical protein
LPRPPFAGVFFQNEKRRAATRRFLRALRHNQILRTGMVAPQNDDGNSSWTGDVKTDELLEAYLSPGGSINLDLCDCLKAIERIRAELESLEIIVLDHLIAGCQGNEPSTTSRPDTGRNRAGLQTNSRRVGRANGAIATRRTASRHS